MVSQSIEAEILHRMGINWFLGSSGHSLLTAIFGRTWTLIGLMGDTTSDHKKRKYWKSSVTEATTVQQWHKIHYWFVWRWSWTSSYKRIVPLNRCCNLGCIWFSKLSFLWSMVDIALYLRGYRNRLVPSVNDLPKIVVSKVQ